MNKVILLGRLGQDVEVKYTGTGTAVANFTLATSESWTDKSGQKQEKTEWSKIVCWANLAELCGKYLQKGSQALVEGKLATRSWETEDGTKKYVTEIIANNVQFLGSKKESSNNQSQEKESGNGFTADDIPF